MISRIVTMATLMAGTALLCLPVQAQTGTSAQSTINSGGASPTGSVGTTSNTPRDNSSSSSTTMGQMGGGTTNSPGPGSQSTMGAGTAGRADAPVSPVRPDPGMHTAPKYQAQAHARAHQSPRMRGGNMAERQVTDCLNTAAAQNQPLDSCKR
jgi:hypothetical protein